MRNRIKNTAGDTVLDLAERQAFRLDGIHYPGDWLQRGGTVPDHTVESYEPPPPPPPTEWSVPLPTFLDRLSDADANAVMTMIEGRPAKLRERLRLRGIPNDQAQVRDWLTTNGYDPDVVLAR